MRFLHALLLPSLLAACVAPVATASSPAAADSAPSPTVSRARPELGRRLAALQDHALRLADLRFGPAPRPRRLHLGPDHLEGRLEITGEDAPSFLTIIARPLDRDSPDHRDRRIERLMPSPPREARGWRVTRIRSIEGEAYGVLTSRSYHVILLFADHLVEIGTAATEDRERKLVRGYAHDLTLSLIEYSDLAPSQQDRQPDSPGLLSTREQPKVLPLAGPRPDSAIHYSGWSQLTDERLITLGELWLAADDIAHLGQALGAEIEAGHLHAHVSASESESLGRSLRCQGGSTTLQAKVTRPAASELPHVERHNERGGGLLGLTSYRASVPPREIVPMPAFEGRAHHYRWTSSARQMCWIQGYLVEISVQVPAEDDARLRPAFLEAQMLRLLGQLGLGQPPPNN